MEDELIIKEMSLAEKTVFLQSSVYLARTDGKIESSEKELITDLIKIYQIPHELFAEITKPIHLDTLLNKIAESIPDRRHALFLIKELLTITNIDDDISDSESDFIEAVAKRLNIEEEKILAIHELIQQHILWLARKQAIMECEEGQGN